MPPNLVAEETVQIILLVLESKSRRFELLQLEFDRNALVQEILAQIPDAATEDVLRRQSYYGICSVAGKEMSPETKLGDSIKRQNEVKIAIPHGLSPKDCAEVAAPILGDEKVQAMLAEAAADDEEDDGKVGIVPVQKEREKKRPKKVKDRSKKSKSSSKDEKDSSKKKSSSKSRVAASSSTTSAADSERKSTSRRSGTASSGTGKTSTSSRSSASRVKSAKTKSSFIKKLINTFYIPVDDSLRIGEYKVTHVTWFCAFLGFFISILCTDIHITMPLRPGARLRTGEFSRKCGYLGMFRGQIPFTCGPEMAAVMDEDSFVNVYEVPLFGERTLLYRIVPETTAGMTDEGLYVEEDGTVTIGGKSVLIEAVAKKVMYEAPEMQPWPFLKGMDLSRKRKNLIGGVVYRPV